MAVQGAPHAILPCQPQSGVEDCDGWRRGGRASWAGGGREVRAQVCLSMEAASPAELEHEVEETGR